jgi:hypothetical protein
MSNISQPEPKIALMLLRLLLLVELLFHLFPMHLDLLYLLRLLHLEIVCAGHGAEAYCELLGLLP